MTSYIPPINDDKLFHKDKFTPHYGDIDKVKNIHILRWLRANNEYVIGKKNIHHKYCGLITKKLFVTNMGSVIIDTSSFGDFNLVSVYDLARYDTVRITKPVKELLHYSKLIHSNILKELGTYIIRGKTRLPNCCVDDIKLFLYSSKNNINFNHVVMFVNNIYRKYIEMMTLEDNINKLIQFNNKLITSNNKLTKQCKLLKLKMSCPKKLNYILS